MEILAMNVETKIEKMEVTTGALPASTKIYVEGSDKSIQVPMRAIKLDPSSGKKICMFMTHLAPIPTQM